MPATFRQTHTLIASACLTTACTFLVAWMQPVRAATLKHDDIAWLGRATFGLDSATLARYQSSGRERYLDDDLDSRNDRLPPAIQSLVDGYDVVRTPAYQLLDQFRQQQLAYKNAADGPAKEAAKKSLQEFRKNLYEQSAQIELLHAIYGGNQLKEQMVWFWLNHFSVYGAKGRVRLVTFDYEENAIRPHALGKFRDLVMATLKSPAMLEFLDNARNVKDQTNENYARELMELHTLGVGSGYTQKDVQQLTLILTGAGIGLRDNTLANRPFANRRMQPQMIRDGLFVFRPRQHDFSDKVFLGHTINGSGYDEIEQAVTLITRQPACATFVSKQIAQYFVADQPPPKLVAAMTRTFQRTDGDIAAVLRTMFKSPLLTSGHEKKFKDPTQFMVSAMRLAYDGKPITNATPLVNWLNQMGEPMYGRITPDGWPLDGASWTGSGQMAKRFDVARVIGTGRNRLYMSDSDNGMPPRDPPVLDAQVYRSTKKPYLSAATRSALGQAKSVQEWNTFLLSSPDFNYR
ncbi:DUF1800 domain-containing protein [Rhodanobacter sp. L36]|uniref:DUF1800 domain-containing protein n=1 Tax=Rhodanobacter sp. L36 TaxID=1747221 RepID=UPI0020B1079F|nr:DUF1800 domain-containing protein [Rhodanobacter sp. L36]